jgi:DnaK suppressor protein
MATDNVTYLTRKSALPVEGIEPYIPKAGEEYMNEKQLAHFRAILMAWKQSLMEEVDRTVDHMKEDATNFSDPADRATQEEEFALALRTRDRERKLIRKIEKTIDRVDADDYGYCDACGVEIGLQRLEVRPTAELCIDCKTTQEIKEKQMAV